MSIEFALDEGVGKLTPDHALLTAILERIVAESADWQRSMAVSIGRASAISGLKESQIRYFEELHALQPAKSTAQSGASRLYTLADLRRLRALALLAEHGYRAAESAALVRANADLVDQASRISVEALIARERGVVADGFFLARLASLLIDTLQSALDASAAHARLRVSALLFAARPLFAEACPDPDVVEQIGRELWNAPADVLVALVRPAAGASQLPQLLLQSTGRDDQTLLYFSTQPDERLEPEPPAFLAYLPPGRLDLALIVGIDDRDAPANYCVSDMAANLDAEQATMLDRLLALYGLIFADFRVVARGRGYRYRSDGFPLAVTCESYRYLLSHIRSVVFPDDDCSMAVLLIPDSLDQPDVLSILAHSGYKQELAAQAKLELRGAGQGLSGRAYCLREPFVSLAAAADDRVTYGHEEDCTVALAVPLAASWGTSPFGVLYLASTRPGQVLPSPVIFATLLLADILSEMLGRWWLTRLRKAEDARLQARLGRIMRWIDSLDAAGPDLQGALDALHDVAATVNLQSRSESGKTLALVVLDIAHYRATIQIRTTDPFPIQVQDHVQAAVKRVLPDQFSRCYWFANDHALLILRERSREQVDDDVQRIADQVNANPVDLRDSDGEAVFLAVGTAVKLLSYRSLADMGWNDPTGFRERVLAIVRYLREEAGRNADALYEPGRPRDRFQDAQDLLR